MRCREAQRLIYLHRQGELPDDTRRQVQDHVASCQRCARELQQVRNTAMVIGNLRRAGPRLHAQRDLTEQIMSAIETGSTKESRSRRRAVVLPFRRLQFSCTLAAAVIAFVFFAQNTVDVYRMANLEQRLSQSPATMTMSPNESRFAAAGIDAIAEFGSMVSGPTVMDDLGLRGRIQLREAVSSFLDVLHDGSPAVRGEVQRLRAKYPELWLISPLNGLTAQDRLTLEREGKPLMRDLRTLLQPGRFNYEE